MVTMTVDLDAPPTTPSMRPPSSCSPHTSISPEAIDEKLKHYVGVFGSRWSLIRAHMTTAFSVAFPARYLENRWEALVLQEQQRSPDRVPLKALETFDRLVPPPPPSFATVGIQERLPGSIAKSATTSPKREKAKRWRCEAEGGTPTQPARPPPPPSPGARKAEALPNGVHPPQAAKLCPTFLLAPGSSLAAPDAVRKQLKAVYLASLLTKNVSEAAAAADKTTTKEMAPMDISDVEQNKASCGGVSAPPTLTVGDAMDASPFASEEEKREVVALLARELAGYKRRGRGSISAGIHGAEVKTEKVESAPPAAKVKSAVKPSTPKAKLLMGSAAPAAANFFAPGGAGRWPSPR